MTSTELSPQQKAAATRKANKFKKVQEKLRKQQEEYRNDPRKLAAAIAEAIRHDNHAGEDPELYENGLMHWFQDRWGSFRFNKNNVLNEKITTGYGGAYFPVSCPTTGCVAGWAASLAGYQLLINTSYRIEFDDLEDAFCDGEVLSVDYCKTPEGHVAEIMNVGGQLLGLYGEKRSWLFSGDNAVEQVLWGLDQIAEHGPDDFDPDNFVWPTTAVSDGSE